MIFPKLCLIIIIQKTLHQSFLNEVFVVSNPAVFPCHIVSLISLIYFIGTARLYYSRFSY